MNQTFQPTGKTQWGTVPGVLLFGFMLGGSVWFGLTQGVPDARVYWLAIAPPFFSALFLLSVWAAIYSVRHRLEVHWDRIIHKGIRSTMELRFGEIESARWRIHPRGIAIKAGAKQIAISFGEYEKSGELPLIRFLRSSIHPQAQRNWERFCWGIALPMRQPKPVPGPGEILLTRRRYDWFGGVLTMTSIGAVLASHAYTERPPLWFGLPLVVLLAGIFWLVLRYSIPARGCVVERTPGMRMTIFLTVSFLGTAIAYPVGKRLDFPSVETISAVGMSIFFVATIVHLSFHVRAREKRDELRAKQSAAEWERLEQAESAAMINGAGNQPAN